MTDRLAGLPPRPGPQAVVAVARGGAIGRGGTLPWHVPEDLAHFKAVTLGHTMVMGAVTWRSIGRPLPGRRTVVVTTGASGPLDLPDGVEVAADPAAGLAVALASDPSPCVVGGARLFDALLPACVRLWRTDIDVGVEGADTFWSEPDGFTQVAAWPGEDPRVTFRLLDRL